MGPGKGIGTQLIANSQDTIIQELHQDISSLQVTVLQAHNLPRCINPFGKKRYFYVVLTNGSTIRKTTANQGEKRAVEWNETLDVFDCPLSSGIRLSLYFERSKHEDKLIGTFDVSFESRINTSFLLNNVTSGRIRLDISINSKSTNSLTTPSLTSLQLRSAQPVPSNASVESAIRRADDAAEMVTCYGTWEKAVAKVRWVMETVSSIAELHPYAKMAYGVISAIPKAFLRQVDADMKTKELLEAIHDAFDFAQEASLLRNLMPESKQANILILILSHVEHCCNFIHAYARDKNFWIRFLKNAGGEANKQMSDLRSTFFQLRSSFMDHAGVITEISVFQILDDMGVLSGRVTGISTRLDKMTTHLSSQILDLDLDHKLAEIPYRSRWRSGMVKSCIPGTRTDFLDYIANWVTNPDSKRGLVLLGQAGTGKSSIAHETARRFQAMNGLTSYFSFFRAEQSKREDYHLFTTIVHDLSQRYPSFKTALGKVIKDNKSLRTAQHYGLLFESMLLGALKDVHIVGPVLIIIDGLDESGNPTGKNELHSFLAEHLAELPANFRVFITSRPETDIVRQLDNSFDIIHMDDPKLSATTDDDIRIFLRKNLTPDTFKKYGNDLAKKSEGLFQWVAVVCGYIDFPPDGLDADDCIRGILADDDELGQDLSPLYQLYKEVLGRYFQSRLVLHRFQSVIGQLLAAFEPLSIQSLVDLGQYSADNEPNPKGSVDAIVCRLGSLLSNVTLPDRNLPIVPLHTSFRDFLTNQQVSGRFYIDLAGSHRQLAWSCLNLMIDKLKFNICKFPSSYYPNDKILHSHIDEHISSALSYACCFWGDHLERVEFKTDFLSLTRSLLEEKFLFWLEVLSLKNSVRLAIPALSSLNLWLTSGQPDEMLEALQELTIDAESFVRYFGMAIAKSAPHIYVSALSFSPTASQVAKRYSSLLSKTLRLTCGQLTVWPAMELNIPTVIRCTSVAVSPDGQRIFSGLEDGSIRLWNATTGQLEGNPFIGHTRSVVSAVFSTDGQHIVSGSKDGTIRLWSATTGRMEGGPITGHTKRVNSVSFSPDGQRIVSGSDDLTIRLWNATTRQMEGSPFTGHTDSVKSVSFSPDGRCIVSGSEDRTIRVWNATTGQTEGIPFTGHTGWVNSVAFASDGQRIVSGSNDETIRVWNVTTGRMEGSPFSGHTERVKSVAFSPDGKRIVSGSYDGTVRVWNTTTGQAEGSPFTGHTGWVKSVVFSPDGKRIISGSHDGTVRVWNATTRQTKGSPSTGHTAWVRTIAFSSDGKRIVSGSGDGTIRIWNAATGQMEGSPFTRHTRTVFSVAFSPDGRRIVSGTYEGTIRVWDANTGQMEGSPFSGHTGSVRSVAFSPDGKHIISGSEDGTIRLWNATTGQTEGSPFTGHTSWVKSVAFSPDGQRIVSGSEDRTIRVWDVTTGQVDGSLSCEHTDSVNSVSFSPDGQHIVSGSQDGTICVWSAITGRMEGSPFTGHTDSVNSVAFSPDGKQITSGSADGMIRVWNATTGQIEGSPFTGHIGPVNCVSFSPNGQQIVSSSNDSTVRLWNAFDMTMASATTNQISFHDGSRIDNDGWLQASSKLLLWIPSGHRLCLPYNVWVTGGHETRLDFSTFVHGKEWNACYKIS